MVEAHELTKHFGRVRAVDRVSFVVEGPGLVGVLGPNGAGKTTTLRLLTGYLGLTAGWARVAGHDVFEAPLEVKASVGYLPETPPLYPDLTVGEYLRFAAELRGVASSQVARRVGEVMARVGLGGWEQRRIARLSKGFRQRVGLAQALVHDPAVLVLDEPAAGLDPAQWQGVRAVIGELAEDRSVLLSSHLLADVETLCDRFVLLHEGRLVADGAAADLATAAGLPAWVELALDAPASDVSARLAGLAEVLQVERLEPGRYRIVGTDGAEPAIASLAGSEGWAVRRLVRHLPSLRDLFLALVEAPGGR